MTDRKKPSDEDIELFRRSVGAARPLDSDRVTPFLKRPSARRRSRAEIEDTDHGPSFKDSVDGGSVAPEDTLLFVRPGVQQRQLQRLQRGRLRPGAELDMHGMTTAIAHDAVRQFIAESRERQIRCVRIIHGKGYGSANKAPVLKNRLNSWLRQHHDVLAFSSTPGRHGGTGAVYVLLRSR